MKDPRWGALELAFMDYMKTNFLESSDKQGTEFDTIWYIAHSEGGKHHLKKWWNDLEANAMNLDD